MTVDAEALHDVLTSLELRLDRVRRCALGTDGLLPLTPGTTSVGYVVSGDVTADGKGLASCTVDATTGRASTAADTSFRTLHAGDAFIALGGGPTVLATRSDAVVVVADVALGWPAAARPLPPFAWVSGFAQLEPAAAALAAHLGPAVGAAPGAVATAEAAVCSRPGDSAICRTMVATVVLSLLRAWSQVGCAPDGWPRSDADDPHLRRAAAAVMADPARDWSVAQLAAVAAMSRSAFAEKFRTAYGRSPVAFVTEVRMRRAVVLLEGGAPVSAAARSLGYASEDGFSRAFRRHTGAPPSQWRARQRGGAASVAASSPGAVRGTRSELANSSVPASSRTSATA
ncbi:helix-turn-helix domain-containing protein [Quadrisphaera oryzae]|uniref:helix-turn-helix domain-containing protein n=1 Tax=Quadrisphaera TaxID=317661 RepID=UPI001644A7E8|nr:AraC family transcriptional regulator [Quadrisphaera sp. RL12-1S]MBC3763938.1 helix-turn-helix transcriptional regulator [Quadrisphaera sp. RL12-1S]